MPNEILNGVEHEKKPLESTVGSSGELKSFFGTNYSFQGSHLKSYDSRDDVKTYKLCGSLEDHVVSDIYNRTSQPLTVSKRAVNLPPGVPEEFCSS